MKNSAVWHNNIPKGKLEVSRGVSLTVWFLCTKKLNAAPLEIILHENTEFTLTGLVAVGQKEHVESMITVTHKGRNSVSRVSFKAVLFDNANLKLEPRAHIIKGARGANTNVAIRTLLVGDSARATSIPSMEIGEQEVSARHAATIGRVDEEELFYVQSRGLDRASGKRLIISGFFNEYAAEAPDAIQTSLHSFLSSYDIAS